MVNSVKSEGQGGNLLTEKSLQSLSESNDGQRISDRESLYGIIRNGKKGVSVLFRWRFRFGGRLHDYNCGTWPGEKLSHIRQKRRDAESILQTGKNPNIEKRAEKLRTIVDQNTELATLADALIKARTVEQSMDDWFKSKAVTSRKDGGAYVKRAFAKDITPVLGHLPISALKRGGLMDALHVVAMRAPVMANRIHAQLSQFGDYSA